MINKREGFTRHPHTTTFARLACLAFSENNISIPSTATSCFRTPSPLVWPPTPGIVQRSLESLGLSQEQESSDHGDVELVSGHSENGGVSFFWVESYLISSRVGHTTKEMAFISAEGNSGAEITIYGLQVYVFIYHVSVPGRKETRNSLLACDWCFRHIVQTNGNPMFIELISKEIPNSVDEVLCYLEEPPELRDKNGMEDVGVQFVRR